MLCTTAFAFAFHLPATNAYLLMSLFLAYATLYPDEQILMFFILPVAIKWLALLDALALLYLVGTLPGLQKLMPLVAVGNYLLFFTPTLAAMLRGFVKRGARAGTVRRFRDDAPSGRKVRSAARPAASPTRTPRSTSACAPVTSAASRRSTASRTRATTELCAARRHDAPVATVP